MRCPSESALRETRIVASILPAWLPAVQAGFRVQQMLLCLLGVPFIFQSVFIEYQRNAYCLVPMQSSKERIAGNMEISMWWFHVQKLTPKKWLSATLCKFGNTFVKVVRAKCAPPVLSVECPALSPWACGLASLSLSFHSVKLRQKETVGLVDKAH